MIGFIERTASNRGPLLVGYCLVQVFYGATPLLYSWVVENTAGDTKISVSLRLYFRPRMRVALAGIFSLFFLNKRDCATRASFGKSVTAIDLSMVVNLRDLEDPPENQVDGNAFSDRYHERRFHFRPLNSIYDFYV